MLSRQGRIALLLLAATCLCDLPVAVRSVAFVPNAFCHAPLARPAGPWLWQAREASGKRRAGGAGAQARRAASGVAALSAQVKPPGKTTPAPALGAVSASQYTWFFLALPALSAAFPALVEAAQAATEQEDRRALIIAFLILKRVYLYACAASIVDIAARRSRDVPQRLGERVQQLNAEIFSGVLSRQQMVSGYARPTCTRRNAAASFTTNPPCTVSRPSSTRQRQEQRCLSSIRSVEARRPLASQSSSPSCSADRLRSRSSWLGLLRRPTYKTLALWPSL